MLKIVFFPSFFINSSPFFPFIIIYFHVCIIFLSGFLLFLIFDFLRLCFFWRGKSFSCKVQSFQVIRSGLNCVRVGKVWGNCSAQYGRLHSRSLEGASSRHVQGSGVQVPVLRRQFQDKGDLMFTVLGPLLCCFYVLDTDLIAELRIITIFFEK